MTTNDFPAGTKVTMTSRLGGKSVTLTGLVGAERFNDRVWVEFPVNSGFWETSRLTKEA